MSELRVIRNRANSRTKPAHEKKPLCQLKKIYETGPKNYGPVSGLAGFSGIRPLWIWQKEKRAEQ